MIEALNLCEPVRDGIRRHSSGAGEPATMEGRIVKLVDRIAYINHDIDDAVRAGVLRAADLPAEEIAILGETGPLRIDTLVRDVVEESERAGDIVQSDRIGSAMLSLRKFMFDRVYLRDTVQREHAKIALVLETLFEHYCAAPGELPPGDELGDRVIDYLAGMTDRFALARFTELTVPRGFAE